MTTTRPYEAWIAGDPFGAVSVCPSPGGTATTRKPRIAPDGAQAHCTLRLAPTPGCRAEEAPPDPRGARAVHRGNEEAVGGVEEGQSGGGFSRAREGDGGGAQTGREARCPELRDQEITAVAPQQAVGRTKAARNRSAARRAQSGTAGGGIAGAVRNRKAGG